MKETKEIIAAYHKAVQSGKKTVLATVVHVEGSSYRRPGARMLVTEDGELTGAISGGCLEGDALRKALLAINQQQNKLVTYNSMDEEDTTIGIQLGCNGIVQILFEPIDASKKNNPLSLLEKTITQEKNSVLVTLFSLNSAMVQPGTCMLSTGENHFGKIADETLQAAILQDMQEVLSTDHSAMKNYLSEEGQVITGFIELVKPPVELIIAGAGNDAFPLVQMAAVLGWHVTVVDGRKTHASAKRFPSVKKIIVSKPAESVQQISITDQTVFILMSHNYNYDLAMLKALATSNSNYIGVLGPKKKLEKMFAELQQQGIELTGAQKEKIYGPIGFNIGAETAEEIALSVMAEIKAVLSKRDGTTLRDKNGFIHEHHIDASFIAE